MTKPQNATTWEDYLRPAAIEPLPCGLESESQRRDRLERIRGELDLLKQEPELRRRLREHAHKSNTMVVLTINREEIEVADPDQVVLRMMRKQAQAKLDEIERLKKKYDSLTNTHNNS